MPQKETSCFAVPRSSNDIRNTLGLGPERELSERVRRAVGFLDAEDLKRSRNGGLKSQAHASRAPFQIILRLTAKAIAKEDGVTLPRFRQLTDLQQIVAIPDAELQEEIEELQDLGMQPWHVLYEPREKRGAGALKEPRWVLDIVNYSNDEDKARKQLYNTDEDEEQELEDKPLRVGWNKHNNKIVILLPTKTMIERLYMPQLSLNWFRFGPILTAFLAAMAVHTPDRWLVILYAVKEIKTLQAEDDRLQLSEARRQWYAFHTLRRIYRMRWGISLSAKQEFSGPLDKVRLTQDLGYQEYLEKTRKAIAKLKK